jgi:hypothetical protein
MNRFASIAFLSLLSASAFAAAPQTPAAPAAPAAAAAPAAPAAPAAAKAAKAPKFNIMNSSTETLVDNATALAIWNTHLTPKVAKLHPVKKMGYISEVNGGFDTSKTCVIVARAMTAQLKGKNFIYNAKNVAVAFGSQAGATPEQCSALAKAKLTEAVQSIAATVQNG